MKVEDLDNKFVVPFADQTQRKLILKRFRAFLEKLSEFAVGFEIWIDGSFLTEKENPDDVDVVVLADRSQMNQLPDDRKNELDLLLDTNESVIRYLTEVHFCESDDIYNRGFWRGWFGFTRNEIPKGFVRLVK